MWTPIKGMTQHFSFSSQILIVALTFHYLFKISLKWNKFWNLSTRRPDIQHNAIRQNDIWQNDIWQNGIRQNDIRQNDIHQNRVLFMFSIKFCCGKRHCSSDEFHYAEWHSAKCCFAECRGAFNRDVCFFLGRGQVGSGF